MREGVCEMGDQNKRVFRAKTAGRELLQNVTLSTKISAAQSLAPLEALAQRFATPFTLVYRCWNFAVKVSILSHFWGPPRALQTGRLARQDIAAS